MKGNRKLIFGTIALAFLAVGLGACLRWPVGLVTFPSYATAVVSVALAVIAGNVGEHLAAKAKP